MGENTNYTNLALFNYSMMSFCLIGAFRHFYEGELDAGYGMMATSGIPGALGTVCAYFGKK